MRRRAHIEFRGQEKIRVTTFCQQKEFDLNKLSGEQKYLDLISLKITTETPKFFMIVDCGNGTINDPYVLEVWAVTQSDGMSTAIDSTNGERWFTYKEKERTFEVSLVEK